MLEENSLKLKGTKITLYEADNYHYNFFIESEGNKIHLDASKTKYLSSEVASEFTGVIIGLYTFSEKSCDYAEFTKFNCEFC